MGDIRDICQRCSISGSRRVTVNTVGSGKCELLLVGLEPSYEDANSGVPFTGNKYNYIWELLSQIGVSFYVTTINKCKTAAGKSNVCIELFREEVRSLRPECILFLGQKTLEYALGESVAFQEYRDFSHKNPLYGDSRLLGTYDPTFIDQYDEQLYKRFLDDLVYACRHAIAYRVNPLYRSITVTKDQFHRLVDIWMKDSSIEYVSFDSESNGLDPSVEGSKITSFSVAVDNKIGYNIFLWHPEMLESITDQDRTDIISDTKRLLTSKKIVVHHAKHEHRMIKVLWGFSPNITDDTMYMSYILYLSQPGISHGLKYLSGRFASLPPWEEILQRFVSVFKSMKRHKVITDDLIETYRSDLSDIVDLSSDSIYRMFEIVKDPNYILKTKEEDSTDPYYWLVPSSVMERYAGMDAIAPLKLKEVFLPQIERDPGLFSAYKRMIRAAGAFADIEIRGCKFIDPDEWSNRYLSIMDDHMKALKEHPAVQEYERDTGNEFSVTSSKCMQDILYNRMKFPVIEYTNTGNPSTGEPAMKALILKMREEYGEDSDDPKIKFLWHLRDYKKMQKIQNTYFVGLQKLVRSRAYDGMHDKFMDIPTDHSGVNRIMQTQYMLHGTDSGRASSNFHTIPHRSDVAKALTSLYYEHGGILFQADHSQLELRVLACLVEKYYGDSALADAYREGKDIHRFNASKVFNKPMEEIVDAERRFSKTISFALCYGSSERSVAESTGRTPEEVHDLFETFYHNFPGVRAYIEDSHRFASQYGCVRTPMGRVRWVPGSLTPEDRGNYSRAMRQAQNQIIQSAGSDLSLATIGWYNQFARTNDLNSQVMNWVHDSITIDAAPGEWIYSYYSILYGMKYLNEKRDWVCAPLGVDVDISPNWSDHVEVSKSHINSDGSWTFTCKGYRDVFDDIFREMGVSYDILQNDILEDKEFTESTGDNLIARKSFNLSYDNKTFREQKRQITLLTKSPKELAWCQEKYRLEQSGSQDMPGDLSDPKELY